MSEFIKKNKFATRGHNVLWFFECPYCGAQVIDNVNDISRLKPCGIELPKKSVSDKIRYCLTELNANGVSIKNLSKFIGRNYTIAGNFIHGEYMEIDVDLIENISTSINVNFIFGRTCQRYRNDINLIKQFLSN